MISIAAPTASGLRRAYADPTRVWRDYLPEKESIRRTRQLDAFLRRGLAGTIWLPAIDEMLFHDCGLPTRALQGVNDIINAVGCTTGGTMVQAQVTGFQRSSAPDAISNSYVNTNKTAADLGWTGSRAGVGLYVTSNFPGIYREFGRSAGIGAAQIAVNASNGLRGYVALGTGGGIGYGKAAAWGMHLFTRVDEGFIQWWRDTDTEGVIAGPFIGFPLGTLGICSAPNTAASSPNAVAITLMHHMTVEQCRQFRFDLDIYVRESGIYNESFEESRVFGPNCFAESDLFDILPAATRLYRHAGFPPYQAAPPSTHNYYPQSDSITGGYLLGPRDVLLPDDSFVPENGSDMVRVIDPGVDLLPGDCVTFLEATTVPTKPITAITLANPGQVSMTGHGYSSGNTVILRAGDGMPEIDKLEVTVTVVNPNAFTIGIDTTGFTPYVSGGTAYRSSGGPADEGAGLAPGDINGRREILEVIQVDATTQHYKFKANAAATVTAKPITAITNANPGKATVVGHGYANGRTLYAAAIGGMTQLNDKLVAVTVVDVDNFTVGIDTTLFGTYTGGGTVRPTIGGTIARAAYITTKPINAPYEPLRGGKQSILTWVNRGKTPPGHPQAARITGGGNGYGGGTAILRTIDSPDGRVKAGAQCRPSFSLWHKAICATEAQLARLAGYLERNEPRDPLGMGYLDIVESGGSAGLARRRLFAVVSPALEMWSHALLVLGSGLERRITITITSTVFAGSTVTVQRSVGDLGNWVDFQSYTGDLVTSTYDDPSDGEYVYYRIGTKHGEYAVGDDITATLTYPRAALPLDRCVTFGEAWSHCDALFTEPQGNFATTYDLLMWYRRGLFELTRAANRKLIFFDWESFDYRPSLGLQLTHARRMAEIVGATGSRVAMSPNIFLPNQIQANGLADGVLNQLVNDPNWETVSILAQKGTPQYGNDIRGLLEAEYAAIDGPLGIPPEKVMLTWVKGGGRWNLADIAPLGPYQLSFEQADTIADFIADKGIVHIRPSNPVGGAIDLWHNQLEMRVERNLIPGPPPSVGDPEAQVDLWIATKMGLGGAMPDAAFRSATITLVSDLMVTEWWDRLDHFTLGCADDLFGHRVCLRRLVAGSFHGAPTLTARHHISYDGVDDATQTGFIAATVAQAIAPTNIGMFWYEMAGGESSTNPCMAMARGGLTNSISLFIPHRVDDGAQYRLNSTGQVILSPSSGVTIGSSLGLWSFDRNATTMNIYHDGAEFSMGHTIGGTTSTLLPDRPLRLGCTTPGVGADVPSLFRRGVMSFAGVTTGGSTVAQQAGLKVILDNYLAAID
jgi:hypothetical protein